MDPVLKEALKISSVAVETALEKYLVLPDGTDRRVVEAMRYAVLAPGKRLRPFLVLATAELFGVAKSRSLRVACAIECLHSYSLIHDDLPAMDNDAVRRGLPTTHIEFDEATAILAGDALQSLAFEILADPETHADPSVRIELVRLLAHAAGAHGMVGGQMIDLEAEHRTLEETDIYRMQQMKTGALISFSCEAAAILGGADPDARQSLSGYARDLGLAFQIADDLLDVIGDADEMGKAAGKDEHKGKATLVGLMGVERAQEQAQLLADQAIEHLNSFGERAMPLRAVAHFAINRRR